MADIKKHHQSPPITTSHQITTLRGAALRLWISIMGQALSKLRQQQQQWPPSLVALPPEVLNRVLLFLPLSSRTVLRRCGSKALSGIVLSFDRNLILKCSSTVDPGREDANDDSGAAWREMIDIVEDQRWLPRLRDSGSKAQDEHVEQQQDGRAASTTSTPGPCHLRRLTTGDHVGGIIPWYTRNNSEYHRKICFPTDAKLIDDRIWVLYSSLRYMFEVFDLDTGRAIESFCVPARGPRKYYVSDSISAIALLLASFDGRYGMLVAGMEMHASVSENPHGAWSGPYVTVWDIATSEVIMSVDLYRPLNRIIEVIIVSRDKVAVLLAGADGVELQWHRIPQTRGEMDGHPPAPKPYKPGAEPLPHQCSNECPIFGHCDGKNKSVVWRGKKEFWEEQRRLECRKSNYSTINEGDDQAVDKASYNSRCDYSWWPVQTTLLQSNFLRDAPFKLGKPQNTTMASDGLGMLVIIVADKVNVWHVGTMAQLRVCEPFSIEDSGDELESFPYHEEVSIGCLCMKTVVHPIDDVLGSGKGGYYPTGQWRDTPPELKRSRRVRGSKNPIDLPHCDTLTLLSRFGHLTYDEQRNFEKGECGRGKDGKCIRRPQKMKEGSCSPQLECIVRVAFAVRYTKDEFQSHIFTMDISPFHHVRNRESSDIWANKSEMNESLGRYEDACLGNSTLWCDEGTWWGACSESGGQTGCVIEWSRGGIFDFHEGGPCDREREQNLNKIIADSGYQSGDLGNYPQLTKLCKIYNDVQEKIARHRSILSLHIDAYKLIISTGYEVAILPLEAYIPGTVYPIEEKWRDSWSDTHYAHRCDTNTECWHQYRPLDSVLMKRWNGIRWYGEMEFIPSEPFDPHRPNNAHTITTDLGECLEQERALMNAVQFYSPRIYCPCISWRYFAVVSCTLSSQLPDMMGGHELLHVFDVLGDWIRENGYLGQPEEAGLLFNGVHHSSSEEESSSSEEESSEEDSDEEESSEKKQY